MDTPDYISSYHASSSSSALASCRTGVSKPSVNPRDWISANTKFPRELAELAHAVKGSAEAAYWRDDALEKRRPMMQAWGRFCVPAKTAKVIPFTAA